MPELIVDGKTGYLIPFAETETFVEKIIQLKDNPELLRELGENAKKHVREHFDFEKNMQKVIELIERGSDRERER